MNQSDRGSLEKKYLKNHSIVIGVDEVGRGCLAGPVYAACVVLDYEKLYELDPKVLRFIRDSKTLSAKQRNDIHPIILSVARQAFIAAADVDEIDQHNILQATFIAMKRAVEQCQGLESSMVLVDGHQKIAGYTRPQLPVVDGDALTFCIAAASILAKQARDDYMAKQSSKYPMYGFERHVGYGTKFHLEMLEAHGACSLHRRSFSPVARVLSRADAALA